MTGDINFNKIDSERLNKVHPFSSKTMKMNENLKRDLKLKLDKPGLTRNNFVG